MRQKVAGKNKMKRKELEESTGRRMNDQEYPIVYTFIQAAEILLHDKFIEDSGLLEDILDEENEEYQMATVNDRERLSKLAELTDNTGEKVSVLDLYRRYFEFISSADVSGFTDGISGSSRYPLGLFGTEYRRFNRLVNEEE